MLVFLTIFLAALALAWGIGFWAASKVDAQNTPIPQWPPAFFMANHFVNGIHARFSLFFMMAGLLCAGLGVFFHNVFGIFFFIAALVIFAPLAFYLCYKIRENAALGSREHVFFNVVQPLAANEERDLALYIEDDEWAMIPAATPYYLKFWQEYHVTGGLYICPCENHVLQAIDSLNLYKYIVNPDHPKMLNAFAGALSAVNPSHTSQSAYARRTFVRLQTQAQGALSLKKKEKQKDDGEDEKEKFSPALPPEIMKMFKHLEEKEKSGESHPEFDEDDDDDDLDDWEKEFLKELEAEHEKDSQEEEKPKSD